MAKKKFSGSWVILIILIICCWPAALVYFFIKYEPQEETRTCMNCGANIAISYNVCPHCGKAPVQPPMQQPPVQ